jgi:hypothetical protein
MVKGGSVSPENCKEINGIVVGCKHYHYCPALPGIHYCTKGNAQIATCENCLICPKCGGQLTPRTDYVPDESPPCFWDRMVCLYCAHQKRGVIIPCSETLPDTPASSQHTKCSVEGCRRHAYEKHTIDIDGGKWTICSFHKDRVYNFLHRKMISIRTPLIVRDGLLFDNPKYLDFSQCGKKRGRR